MVHATHPSLLTSFINSVLVFFFINPSTNYFCFFIISSSFSIQKNLFKTIPTMSCCNGNCGCGSACKCGSGCGGCKMFPDFGEASSNSAALISGVAPTVSYFDAESEMGVAAENGCKCGDNCQCDPCTCK